MVHIGSRIKEEVRLQGLTNEKFAAMINVNQRTVNKLYNKQFIDLLHLYQISKVLNKDFFQFYSDELKHQ